MYLCVELYCNVVIFDLCNLFNVFIGFVFDDSVLYIWIVFVLFLIVSVWMVFFFRNTNSYVVGAYGSFSINNMLKFIILNILYVLLFLIVVYIFLFVFMFNLRILFVCV